MLSIIIPTRNCARYIAHSLTSLVTQTDHRFEVIVVDGSSNDGTLEAIRLFKDRLAIRIVDVGKASIGAARNRGIDAAAGDCVAFLDADDYYLSQRVALAATALEDDARYDAAFSDFVHLDAISGKSWLPHFYPRDEDWRREIFSHSTINLNSLTVRKSFLQTHRIHFTEGVRGRLGEDWDFAAQLVTAGCRFGFHRDPTVVVLVRSDSHTSVTRQWKMKVSTLRTLLDAYQVLDSERRSAYAKAVRRWMFKTALVLGLSGRRRSAFRAMATADQRVGGYFPACALAIVGHLGFALFGFKALEEVLGMVSDRSRQYGSASAIPAALQAELTRVSQCVAAKGGIFDC